MTEYTLITRENYDADLDEIKRSYDKLAEGYLITAAVDLDKYDTINTSMQSGGAWGGFGTTFRSALMVEDFTEIHVKANSTRNAYLSFLKAVPTAEKSSISFCADAPTRVTVPVGTEQTLAVPADCKCIVVTLLADGFDFRPEVTGCRNHFAEIDRQVDKTTACVAALEGRVAGFEGTTEITGHAAGKVINTKGNVTVPPTRVDRAASRCVVVACTAGDEFTINTTSSGDSYRAWAFFDENGKLLKNAAAGSVCVDEVIKAPKGAAMLILNDLLSNSTAYKGTRTMDRIDAMQADLAVLKNSRDSGTFTMNDCRTGMDNMIWSWWVYPQAVSFKRVRSRLYWTYTTADGHSGIAAYDFDTRQVVKNNLKAADVDDHNAPAVHIFDDGVIMCAYAGGHYVDHRIHVRVSATPESIEYFGDDIGFDCTGETTYSQIVACGEKVYVFYRSGTNAWAYRFTTDRGATWSAETVLITASVQYYCKFVPTTASGVIRVIMYSNPEQNDHDIRQAFLHTDNDTLYNSDNSTLLGKENISNAAVTAIVPLLTGWGTQRLFDVAVTPVERPLILYATYNGGSPNDSAYRVYDSGAMYVLANGGRGIKAHYQCGCAWIGTDRIACIRNDNHGTDVVELYRYSGSEAPVLDQTVYTEATGSLPIRNARPIVDINCKAFLWQRGYYNYATFVDFNTDGMLHLLE